MIDTIFTTTNLLSVLIVAGQSNVTNKEPRIMLGLSAATIWVLSAGYGYSKTNECEEALRVYDDDGPAPPVLYRPRRPTPQPLAPAGIVGPPPAPESAGPVGNPGPSAPPSIGDPTAAPPISPTPAAPVGSPRARAVPQQTDDDAPEGRPRPAPTGGDK